MSGTDLGQGRAISGVIAFGGFVLDPEGMTLHSDGGRVRLGSRAMAILVTLATRRGETIPNEVLIKAAWPSTHVDETNLRVNISAIRKALGDTGDDTRFIVNVPGRGYVFRAELSEPASSRSTTGTEVEAVASGRRASTPIGRDGALDDLLSLVERSRIVTIVGPGGIGKTTVMSALWPRLHAPRPQATAWLDLAPLAQESLVLPALAERLGIALPPGADLAELIARLGTSPRIIALDCCEHVVETVARIAESLTLQVPQISIVATSREPLRVEGELVYRLPALDLPRDGCTDIAEALACSAVRLFVERVDQHLGGYTLTVPDVPVVTAICRRLDGIALALELAAGRVESLGLAEVAASLRVDFDALTMGRRTALPHHRTLKAAIDWSYRLLSESEQRVLAHLALFSAGFTLQAAQAVVGDTETAIVTEAISELVAKSLLLVDRTATPPRYRLLDMTRAFAAEKLRAFGEMERTAARHARHFARMIDRCTAEAGSAGRLAQDMAADLGNLRAALDWGYSADGDKSVAVALTVATIPIWYELSLVDECLSRVAQAIGWLERQPDHDPAIMMKLYAALGFPKLRGTRGVPSGSDAWKKALEIARRIGDVDYQLRANWALWVDLMNRGEVAQAEESARGFWALSAQADDPMDRFIADRMLARTLHFRGQQSEALELIRRMLAHYHAPEDGTHLARFQYEQAITGGITLARVSFVTGDVVGALEQADRLVEAGLELGHELTLAHALADAACPLALMAGDAERADTFITLLSEHTRQHALDVWHTYAAFYRGELIRQQGNPDKAASMMEGAARSLAEAGFGLFRTWFDTRLADCLLVLDRHDEALRIIRDTSANCARTGEAWYMARVLQVEGAILLALGDADAAEALRMRAELVAAEQGAAAFSTDKAFLATQPRLTSLYSD